MESGLGRRSLSTVWPALALSLMVLAIYYLCLRYVFPGYFRPLAPHHLDMYLLAKHGDVTCLDLMTLASRPRAVGWFFFDLFCNLGLKPMLLSFSAVALGSLALNIASVRPLVAPGAYRWTLVALYLVNVFSHPGFYINYNYDLFNTIASAFLAGILYLWYQGHDRPSSAGLVPLAILTALIVFTKESLFLTLVILWSGQAVITTGGRRRTALIMLAITAALITSSMLHSHLVGSPWASVKNDRTHPYFICLEPKSLWETYWYYLGQSANRYNVLMISIAIASAVASGSRWKDALLFVVMGLATYVPLAVLPNHKHHYYLFVGAPLGFLPLLLIDPTRLGLVLPERIRSHTTGRVVFGVIAIALACLTLGSILKGNRKTFEAVRWYADQEKINHNLVDSLPRVARMLDRPSNILVVGLKYPFHPFAVDQYVFGYFGSGIVHRWTVIDHLGSHTRPGEAPQVDAVPWTESHLARAIRWVDPHTERVDFRDYDLVLLFGPDGRLQRSATRADLRPLQIAASQIPLSCLETPEFYDANARLSGRTMDDWRELLDAGIAWKERVRDRTLTELFLRRAVLFAGAESPLPSYQLGTFHEASGDDAEAAASYRRAVEIDHGSSGTRFEEALRRVGTRLSHPGDLPHTTR